MSRISSLYTALHSPASEHLLLHFSWKPSPCHQHSQFSLPRSGAQVFHHSLSCQLAIHLGHNSLVQHPCALLQAAAWQSHYVDRGSCASGDTWVYKKRAACIYFIKSLILQISLCASSLYRSYDFWESHALMLLSNNSLLPNGKWCLTCFPLFVLSNIGCQDSV